MSKNYRANKSRFTDWAIIVVSILIGLTVLVIGGLTYALAGQEPTLPWFASGLGITPTATRVQVTPSSTAPVRERFILPTTPVKATRVPINPPAVSVTTTRISPLRTATEIPEATPAEILPQYPPATVLNTDAPASSLPGIPETPYVHPTYEPTTQPCQSCHHEISRNGGG